MVRGARFSLARAQPPRSRRERRSGVAVRRRARRLCRRRRARRGSAAVAAGIDRPLVGCCRRRTDPHHATIDPKILAEAFTHLSVESPRALLDLMLRLHGGKPVAAARLFVLGSHDDRISAPADVNATASLYGIAPIIVRGLAHMMMLEREWETAARPLLDWLEREVVSPSATASARRASRS